MWISGLGRVASTVVDTEPQIGRDLKAISLRMFEVFGLVRGTGVRTLSSWREAQESAGEDRCNSVAALFGRE
jgi:hypothetical protein